MMLWVLLCWSFALAMGIKAIRARAGATRYVWSWWDGGALMRGKETSPTAPLVVAIGLGAFGAACAAFALSA